MTTEALMMAADTKSPLLADICDIYIYIYIRLRSIIYAKATIAHVHLSLFCVRVFLQSFTGHLKYTDRFGSAHATSRSAQFEMKALSGSLSRTSTSA